VLTLNRGVLDQVAHALMEQESLEGDALDDLLLNIKGASAPETAPAGASAVRRAGPPDGSTSGT
jgi:hypothetical protein